jgi:hypothetical protein
MVPCLSRITSVQFASTWLAAVDDHAGAALVAGLLAVGEEQVVKG